MSAINSSEFRGTELETTMSDYAAHSIARTRNRVGADLSSRNREGQYRKTAHRVLTLLATVGSHIGAWIRSHVGATIAAIFAVLVLVAVFFPSLFTRYSAEATSPSESLQAPSLKHIFGTDLLGRDLFSRVVYGGKTTLLASLIALAIAVTAGLVIGIISGYAGSVVDTVLMRFIDVWLAIPGLLLAITIVTAIGFGSIPVAIAIGIGMTPAFARTTRSQVLKVKTSAYIEAAEASGDSTARIILTHILPNSLGPVIVMALLEFGGVIMGVATLSFLGFGEAPPAPEWGSLINAGRDYLVTAPWLSLLPGLVVVLTALSITIVARALRKGEDQ